jgi:hypothetical protein
MMKVISKLDNGTRSGVVKWSGCELLRDGTCLCPEDRIGIQKETRKERKKPFTREADTGTVWDLSTESIWRQWLGSILRLPLINSDPPLPTSAQRYE